MLFSLVEVVVVVVVVVVVGIMIVVFVVVDDGYDFSYVYLTCIQNVSLYNAWNCVVVVVGGAKSFPCQTQLQLRLNCVELTL